MSDDLKWAEDLGRAAGGVNKVIDRLTKERNELREALRPFADRIEKLAFEMPPPNAYTPRFVELAMALRALASVSKTGE